jgi:hypothetical protein
MGGLTASGSLITPVDLARFTLAYLAIALIPGYAMAVLARPRSDWIERLAFAIPCAYTLVALSGLATALLHLPFGLATYAALALPITLAGGYTAWRRKPAPADCAARDWQTTPTAVGAPRQTTSPDSAPGRWWLSPVGVAIAQVGALILVHARDVVPPGSDVVSHVIWTNLVARSHIFPIALLSSHIGTNDGGFYPPVFHALTALVLNAAPMATYRAVFVSALAAIALLPLALFCYVRTATGSARLAGLAALASLAFEPLPFFVLSLAFYPFIVSLLFAPAIAMALCDGLGHGDRRAVALAAALGVGLFYTHPTEFLTAGLLTLAIVPGRLRSVRARARTCIYGIVVIAIWLLAAAPALRAVHTTMVTGAQAQMHTGHNFVRSPHVDLQGLVRGYLYWVYGLNLSYVLLAAVAGGVAWCLFRRRLLGLVAVQAIVLVLFVDSNSYNVLRPLYVLSYPWPLWDRLAATNYWLALPLAAIGIDSGVRLAWRFLHTKAVAFVAIGALPFVLLGVLLPLGVASGRAAAYYSARNVVAPADFGAIHWLARHASSDSMVANDGDMKPPPTFDVPIDAGLWMPALDGPQPSIWRQGGGPGTLGDRIYLLQHIADDPMPPQVTRFIRENDIRYVFYGAGVRRGATRHLTLARLLADPHLRLVYSSVAACRKGDRVGRRCPSTGSYVFAIEDNSQPRGD